MDHNELLIDFNSPVSKCSYQTPLIPMPIVNTINESVSPTKSNPFDAVAKQASPPKDPFESVFKTAFNNASETRLGESPHLTEENDKFKSITCEALSPSNNVTEVQSQQRTTNDPSSDQGKETKQASNDDGKIVDRIGDHNSLLLADLSSEDGLRNFIANRVKNCIQKALNSSSTGRISKSNDNLWSAKDGTHVKCTYNRRSRSFVLPSSMDSNYCDKHNKSCSDSIGDVNYFLSNSIQLNVSSNNPQNSSFLSTAFDESSNIEDSASDLPEEEKIFHEANKIARIISNSCCKIADEHNEDNWLSSRPQWLDSPGSDDEEERLLRDPALNVRVSLVKPLNRSSGDADNDSEALSAYKARRNRSLGSDQLDATAEEASKIKRNILKPIASMSALPSVPAILVKPDENIRLKKKGGCETKRGPMRAMMPIQSMTKETLAVPGKLKIRSDTSPIRRQTSAPVIVTPQKNPESTEMRPVASSTPTRREVVAVPAVAITPMFNAYQRHSVDITVDELKSQTGELEVGKRLRSTTSGSSIPTVVSTARAPKAIPTLKNSPRSTSSLPRHSFQMKTALSNSNIEKKSKPLKTSYNSRALSDLKTASPRRGIVKSAVNTMSSLVSGKGKKRSFGDKENKVPI